MRTDTARKIERGVSGFICLLCLGWAWNAFAVEVVVDLAGGGSVAGYAPGDANLQLQERAGLVFGPGGELFFSDVHHNQVLKANPRTGRITLVAGNGARAFDGDSLPAPNATVDEPAALAFDAAGNLFIVDNGNSVIRRVDAKSQIITTVAGTPHLTTGKVVNGNPPAPLGDGGPAIAATFAGNIGGITVDSAGNLIVADTENNCIRRITFNDGLINTIVGSPQNPPNFAGDGVAGGAVTAVRLRQPLDVIFDAQGNLYIADSGNHRVRKLDGTNTVTTVVGDGTGGNNGFSGDGEAATQAQIGLLGGLAIDPKANLLITCRGADCIRLVDITSPTPIIRTVAGRGNTTLGDGGPANGATLETPRDIAVDAKGDIFVFDSDGFIRRVDGATGFIETAIGTGLNGFVGDRGKAQFSVLEHPSGVAYDAAGVLYIADSAANAVRCLKPDGTFKTFAGVGSPELAGDGGPANLAALDNPNDVAVFGSKLFIADFGNNCIRVVDLTTGHISTSAQVSSPVALAIDTAGMLYVAHNNQVDKVALDGTVTPYVGDNPSNVNLGDGLTPDKANLAGPSGLALGPAGELYIADKFHNRIRLIRVPPNSITSTFAGGGVSTADGVPALQALLNKPGGVALDATHNRVVISDTGNNNIRAVDLGGSTLITTIAGTGAAGYNGSGLPATGTFLNSPGRIIGRSGILVFADGENRRIREIVSTGTVDPKAQSLSIKLNFTKDKKTGDSIQGKDSVTLKTAFALPAGINPANLIIGVDIADLHQDFQLDKNGKLPKPAKAPKGNKASASANFFDFQLPRGAPAPTSAVSLGLKSTSVAGGKPVKFSFSSKGTFRDQFGRSLLTNENTPKAGRPVTASVTVTLGDQVFNAVANLLYKAKQDKNGTANSVKSH